MKKILLVLFVLCLFLITGCFQNQEKNDEPIEQPSQYNPSISVSDQTIERDIVLISKVTFDKPGYIIIHGMKSGNIEEIIGSSDLHSEGLYENVGVSISVYEEYDRLAAVLYYDDGDDIFEVPGQDKPINSQGGVMMQQFGFSVIEEENNTLRTDTKT